jgi:hypothetical protein
MVRATESVHRVRLGWAVRIDIALAVVKSPFDHPVQQALILDLTGLKSST